jgi:iron complex outermembrane receptor protein
MNYSYTNFSYVNYESNGERLDGNKLPGIPQSFGNISVDYQFKHSGRLHYERTYRGKLFTNDDNTTSVAGFWRDDISYKLPLKSAIARAAIILGCSNLLNVKYSDNIRINAFGSRFYEAAPERTLYTALLINF